MADIKKIRLSGVTYNIVDDGALRTLDNTVTSGGTNAVRGSGIYDAITASSAAVLETVGQAGYQTSTDVQNAIANKVDSSAITSFFGAVNYDSSTKHINFYNESTGGTVLAYVDATDFVKDGMVDNVEIKDVTISGESVTCLVITFNTDSGKEEIDIPLTDIFDPSNYVDVNTYTAYTAATDTALSGKQDTLISGTSIKTINNESLLGSGNINIEAAGTVDQTIISGSTNAVAGGAVYTALAGKNGVVTLDNETLVIS